MNTTYRKFGVLSSSEDPQKLGDTVKGIILGLGSVLILSLHFVGIDVGSAEVSQFAVNAGLAVSSIWTAYGLIKKAIVWVQSAWANRSRV